MSNEAETKAPQKAKEVKGRFSWVVLLFEFFTVIGYIALAWKALFKFVSSFNFFEFFSDIEGAIYFLIGCTVISTVMCFIPIFKSKRNMNIAVCNIVWLAFNLFGLFA